MKIQCDQKNLNFDLWSFVFPHTRSNFEERPIIWCSVLYFSKVLFQRWLSLCRNSEEGEQECEIDYKRQLFVHGALYKTSGKACNYILVLKNSTRCTYRLYNLTSGFFWTEIWHQYNSFPKEKKAKTKQCSSKEMTIAETFPRKRKNKNWKMHPLKPDLAKLS